MIGFNSREKHQDAIFDIQTQNLGGERVLETRIYRNGKILATVRRGYPEGQPVSSVHEALSGQHEEICEKVRDGTYALVFLWISRGIIHFEAGDHSRALECFESVMALDEQNAEVKGYLEQIRAHLEKDRQLRHSLREKLENQAEELSLGGRQAEADRKKALLGRLGIQKKTGPGPAGTARQLFRGLSRAVRVPLGRLSMQMVVTVSLVLLILCVGFIQADGRLTRHPDHCDRIAGEYLRSDRVLPARELYQQLLLLDPGSREALAHFWETFHRTGDHPAAIATLEGLAGPEPPSPLAVFCLAEAYRQASRCDDAIARYREALARGIPEVPGTVGWGLCLLKQGRTEEAIRLWEDLQASGRGEDDPRVDLCLGRAYRLLERPGRASVHFSRALKQDPLSMAGYLGLADCLDLMHQTEEAQKLRERAGALSRTAAAAAVPAGEDPFSVLPDPAGPVSPGTF